MIIPLKNGDILIQIDMDEDLYAPFPKGYPANEGNRVFTENIGQRAGHIGVFRNGRIHHASFGSQFDGVQSHSILRYLNPSALNDSKVPIDNNKSISEEPRIEPLGGHVVLRCKDPELCKYLGMAAGRWEPTTELRSGLFKDKYGKVMKPTKLVSFDERLAKPTVSTKSNNVSDSESDTEFEIKTAPPPNSDSEINSDSEAEMDSVETIDVKQAEAVVQKNRIELFRAFRAHYRNHSEEKLAEDVTVTTRLSKNKGVTCDMFFSYCFKTAIIDRLFPDGIPEVILKEIEAIEGRKGIKEQSRDNDTGERSITKLEQVDASFFEKFEALVKESLASTKATTNLPDAMRDQYIKFLYSPTKGQPIDTYCGTLASYPELFEFQGYMFLKDTNSPAVMSHDTLLELMKMRQDVPAGDKVTKEQVENITVKESELSKLNTTRTVERKLSHP